MNVKLIPVLFILNLQSWVALTIIDRITLIIENRNWIFFYRLIGTKASGFDMVIPRSYINHDYQKRIPFPDQTTINPDSKSW